MKKKIWITIIFVVLLFGVYKIYTSYADSKYIEEVNISLREVVEPYINDITVNLNDEKYFLGINRVEIKSKVKDLKESNRGNSEVFINIYENDSEEIVYTGSIFVETFRNSGEDEFKVNMHDSISYYSDIYDMFVIYKDGELKERYMNAKINNDEVLDDEEFFGNGFGTKDEEFEMNEGIVTKPGKGTYDSVFFNNDYSTRAKCQFYIEDFVGENEMNISFEYKEADYNPLWYVNEENTEKIRVVFADDRFEGISNKEFTDEDEMQEIISFIHGLDFKYFGNQHESYMNNQLTVYITMDSGLNAEFNILDNLIILNGGYAIYEGEKEVEELVNILESSGTVSE